MSLPLSLISIILVGVLMAIYMLKTDNIWEWQPFMVLETLRKDI
ncbi:protein of unknown function [Streptococcus thermophilus]|nr:hypothetical protein [Streptococcus thermophilus]CAD0147112.1 protein of unknown function [Streptococcus thermophilus]CAD0150774.1 protein of unknown function [Streptococcus thermophilus]